MLSRGINKSHIWVFIICLLIITVNILVITGYIQIKYSKNLYAKNNNLSDNKNENILKENKELKDTIDSLKKDMEKQKEETAQAEQKYKSAKENNANILNMYEDIMEAEILRQNGDLTGAADSLKSVNRDYLLSNASELDNQIRSEVSKPAAIYFYKTGLNSFSNGIYDGAQVYFKKSLYYIEDEDFKDDCSFYLGKSYFMAGNIDVAKKTIKQFIDDFPDSKYIGEAKELYAELE